MGSEQLEEGDFEPMFAACEGKLAGKKIALFGSYGWGDGEWMRNWEDTCRSDGAVFVCDSVICREAPARMLCPAAKRWGRRLQRKRTEEHKDEYVTECAYCSCGVSFDAGFLLRHKGSLPEDTVKNRRKRIPLKNR